jgi:sodium/potassium/calcium exchanger 6
MSSGRYLSNRWILCVCLVILFVQPKVVSAEQLHNSCLDVKNAVDKCHFVKEHCKAERIGYVDYLQGYYCAPSKVGALVYLGFTIVWLICLFMTIGIAASDFVCPNLNTMATSMGLSESLIGVTFLAFGNGSPDVFSTYAAMKIGSGSLAIGELIGAASFITAVVSGSMALVRPFKVSRKSFVRDALFFAAAIAFAMYFMSDGLLQLWECIVMLVIYILYVIFVVWWHWYKSRKRQRLIAEMRARNFYADDTPVGQTYNDIGGGYDYDDDDYGAVGDDNPLLEAPDFSALSRSNRDPEPYYRDDSGVNAEDEEQEAEEAYEEITRYMSLHRQYPELRRGGRNSSEESGGEESAVASPPMSPISAQESSHSRHQAHHHHQRSKSRDMSAPIRPSLFGALEFRSLIQKLEESKVAKGSDTSIPMSTNYQGSDSVEERQQQPNIPHLIVTDSSEGLDRYELDPPPPAPPQSPSMSITPSQRSRRSSTSGDRSSQLPSTVVRQVWRFELPKLPVHVSKHAFFTLFPTLDGLTGKPWYGMVSSILAAPSVLLLTMTVPVYDTKNEENVCDSEDNAESIKEQMKDQGKKQVSRWLLVTQSLLAPLFVSLMGFGGRLPLLSLLLGSAIASFILLIGVLFVFPPNRELPRTCVKHVSFLGFLISISWVSTIANEVVAVLKMLGTVYHISDAILGLTVFAMGNSLGDLVSNLTIAKMGYPMMALSACFGGPMLNIMVGIGVSCLVVMIQQKKTEDVYKIELSPTLIISGATLLLTLLLLLIAVPLNNWEMSRTIGCITILFWAVSTVLNVIIELTTH